MRRGGSWRDSFLIAFGMYSRIPVPRTDWDRASMDYVMCFFPFVGAVLGGLSFLLQWGCARLGLSPLLAAALLVALPLWATGGIHMDGYMDTRDALASCQDRETKLTILKDSHAGAFAVMGCALYLLLSFGAWGALAERGAAALAKGISGWGTPAWQAAFCVCAGYMVSRTLSALSVILFPKAKKTGSYVALFSGRAARRQGLVFLGALLAAEAACLGALGGWRGLLTLLAAAAVFGWYYHMSKKQFGGITGDLAGYFVQQAELAVLLAMAVTG